MSAETLGGALPDDVFAALANASRQPKKPRGQKEAITQKRDKRIPEVDGRTIRHGHERTKALNVKMHPDYKQEVDDYCKRTGKSLTDVVELALLQYVRGN